jgi:hypothetical protein
MAQKKGRSMRGWPKQLWILALIGALGGCGGDDDGVVIPCTEVDGACVGIPVEPLCPDAVCSAGVACGRLHAVANDGQLDAAIVDAAPGDCIALNPGTYKGVALPMGVSLLGRGANDVATGPLELATGTYVRGIEARGGITIGTATEVVIDAVRIRGGRDGIAMGPGASLTVTRSEVVGAELRALLARDSASLTLERSIVRGAGDGGLWVQCGAGCGCAAKPDVSLDYVLFDQNRYVSVFLHGARARMTHTHLIATLIGKDFARGGGLTAAGCSDLSYAKLFVQGPPEDPNALGASLGYGVLIDRSSARPLGNGLEENGIIIVNGRPGIWIQASGAALEEPDQTVVLDGVDVQGAYTAGIGFDLGARGIIIVNGKVSATQAFNTPSEHGGSANLGIGLVWKDGSAAQIDGLDLMSSATASFLIDGPVGENSAINFVSLTGGDEEKGIVQQFAQTEADAPQLGLDVPAIVQSAELVSDVPSELPVAGAIQ